MKSRMSKVGDCKICGTTTRSLGFRVFVCKACAMYYRRTFHIRDKLRCSNNGNCQLVGTHRSNCRSCRMEMCRAVGLRMVNSSLVVQHNGYPVDDIIEVKEEPQFVADPYLPQTTEQTHIQQTPSTFSSNPPSCSTVIEPLPNYPICELTNVDAFKNFPLLQSAAKLYNQFEMRQRNLVESYRSSVDVQSQQSTFIDNTTFLSVENGSLHLLCITLGQFLQEYCTQDWLKIVKASILQTSLLHKLGLTVRQFPKRDDPRLACFLGAHVDSTDLFNYLGTNYESRKNFVRPFWKVWVECAQRFKEIEPSAEESMLIILGFILEEAERQGCLAKKGSQLKDKLYFEFYGFLTELHGPTASIRLIKLLALQMDAKHLADAQLQMMELIRVFRPDICEYIWHDRILADDNSFLMEYQKIANEISC